MKGDGSVSVKDFLLATIMTNADWHLQKAVEHPYDIRNRYSADALREVADLVSALPDSFSLFGKLAEANKKEGWAERENLFLARWGFCTKPTRPGGFLVEFENYVDDFIATCDDDI